MGDTTKVVGYEPTRDELLDYATETYRVLHGLTMLMERDLKSLAVLVEYGCGTEADKLASDLAEMVSETAARL